MRPLILSAAVLITATVAPSVNGQSPRGMGEKQELSKRDPLQLPFGVEPSTRSLESSQRLKDELRDQDLRVDPDPNRRMFRPKQPEPGYSEIRPYPGANTPTRVDPMRPIP